MNLEHWIAIGVAVISFLSAVVVSFVNKHKELKFKKFEYKAELYFQYLSSSVVQKTDKEQTELVYKLMIIGGNDVVGILREIHFGKQDSDHSKKALLNKRLISAMRAELHGKRGAEILDNFPDSVFM